jgi:hypothetical protein
MLDSDDEHEPDLAAAATAVRRSALPAGPLDFQDSAPGPSSAAAAPVSLAAADLMPPPSAPAPDVAAVLQQAGFCALSGPSRGPDTQASQTEPRTCMPLPPEPARRQQQPQQRQQSSLRPGGSSAGVAKGHAGAAPMASHHSAPSALPPRPHPLPTQGAALCTACDCTQHITDSPDHCHSRMHDFPPIP